MTINGPAPMVLGFFFNAAIDQQIERHLQETGGLKAAQAKIAERWKLSGQELPQYVGDDRPTGDRAYGLALLGGRSIDLVDAEVYNRIQSDTLTRVRGTVQADILKEDQAQNTCIFSTELTLRMMGDMQAYFVDHQSSCSTRSVSRGIISLRLERIRLLNWRSRSRMALPLLNTTSLEA